jgi:hypothetical protein
MTGNFSTLVSGHRLQADDARGGLFGAADDVLEHLLAFSFAEALAPSGEGSSFSKRPISMKNREKRGRRHRPGHVGLVLERGADVLEVGNLVFALDGDRQGFRTLFTKAAATSS